MTKTKLIEYCYVHSVRLLSADKMYKRMKKSDLMRLYTKMRIRENMRDVLPFCEKASTMWEHYTYTIKRLTHEISEIIDTFKISSNA